MPPVRLHPALRWRLLGVHLIGLLAVSVAVSLGVWQYEAWQRVRDLAATQVSERDPVELSSLLTPGASFPGTDAGAPVTVEGTWASSQTFFIDDRKVGGETGYWVITPLVPVDGDGALLPVVRGWVEDLDDVPPDPQGATEFTGWLQPGEGTGATDEDATDRVLPQVRLADVVRLLDSEIYDGYVVVDAEAASVNAGEEGLAPVDATEVPTVSAGTGLRNLLYAIEWWFFAAFAAFVWWRFVRDEVEKERMVEEHLDDEPEDLEPQAPRVPSSP